MENVIRKTLIGMIAAGVLCAGCGSSQMRQRYPLLVADVTPQAQHEAIDMVAWPSPLQKAPASVKKKSRVELPPSHFQEQEQVMIRYYESMIPK